MPASPIKPSRTHVIEQAWLFLGEALCGLGPAGARLDGSLNHDGTFLNPKFDLLAKPCLLDQGLREADAARVADSDDPRLHGITM